MGIFLNKLLFLLLLIASALSLVNCPFSPQATTEIVPYSPPIIQSLSVKDELIILDIMSFETSTDISNYNIFISTTSKDLERVNNTPVTNLLSLNQLPFFFTNTERPNLQTGYQTLIFSNSIKDKLNTFENYYLATTSFGVQPVFASRDQHNGWLQSDISDVQLFHYVLQTNLTISNILLDEGTNSGIYFDGTQFMLNNSVTHTPDITNTLYLNTLNGSSASTKQLVIVNGADSDCKIQLLGIVNNPYEVIDLPSQDNYQTADMSIGIPVVERQLFAVYDSAKKIYFKFYINKIYSSISTDNENLQADFGIIDIDIIYTQTSEQRRL